METAVRTAAHNRWWRIGEVVLGVPLFAAILLQWLVPVALPTGGHRGVTIAAGVVLSIMGLQVIRAARRELARYRQPTDPGHPTERLVTTGIFAYSRNPLYVGAVLFLIGLALAAGLTWMLVLLPLTVAACYFILIAPEERYLTATFGVEYAGYVRTVCRWMGRPAS